MKKTISLLFILVLTLSYTTLSAGTTDRAEIAGFSIDGKYAALQISGIEDGSGFYYITLRILNVHKNSFASPRITLRQTDEEPSGNIRIRAYKKAEVYFSKYQIIRSVRHVSLKLEGNDLKKTFTFNNKNYTVKIDEIDTGTQCNSMSGMFTGKGFSISLNGSVLDKVDSPGECAFGYAIDSAVVYNNHIIIIYRVLSPGFEGADSRVLFSSSSLD